jgi:Ran GTPase-activating protein (RanGAP) involved in mRNA processing and transport/serine/threonine protein kinase
VCFNFHIGLSDFLANNSSTLWIPQNCTAIYLQNNYLGNEGIAALADALAYNTAIQSIQLRNNGIGAEGAASLAEALKVNTAINQVVLDSSKKNLLVVLSDLPLNIIGDAGAASLADALKVNAVVETLFLSDTGIGYLGAAALAEAMKANVGLISVDLSDNVVGNAGCALIAEALQVNKNIAWLNLGSIGITAEGATSLAEALMVNRVISYIDLDYNDIGDVGASSIAAVLEENTVLTNVGMFKSGITAKGAASLAKALMTNTALVSVALRSNAIGDDGAASLAAALMVNTAIASVNFHSCRIGDAGAASLAEAFKLNAAITWVDLASNEFGTSGARSLAEAFKVNAAITWVDLSENNIDDASAGLLAASFAVNTAITSVDLRENHIGDIGTEALAEALKVNTMIKVMDLRDNGIGPGWIAAMDWLLINRATRDVATCSGSGTLEASGECRCSGLALLGSGPNCKFRASDVCAAEDLGLAQFQSGAVGALKIPPRCKKVDLSHTAIGDAGVAALVDALRENGVISSLDLRNANISPAGARSLAQVLANNTALAWLNLENNAIGASGAGFLAAAFATNTAVVSLDLSNNRLEAAGAASFAAAFKVNTAVTSVDMSANAIGDEGATSLAGAFAENKAIVVINLSKNSIGRTGAAALAQALKLNTAIEAVYLHNNQIGSAGAVALAEAFMVNKVITTVYLASNAIGDEGSVALAAAFKVNRDITTVSLDDNDIGDTGAAALANAFKVNTAIRFVGLYRNSMAGDWVMALVWLIGNAGSRSVTTCSGSGTISESTGKCQCSGLALLGTGPSCSDLECVASDVDLSAFQAGEVDWLTIPQHCTAVNLHNSGITDAAVAALAKALKVNGAVTSIDLSSNSISDGGAAKMAAVLIVNPAIVTVDFSGNQIGERWMLALECYSPYSSDGSQCSNTVGSNAAQPKQGGIAVAVVAALVAGGVVSVAGLWLALRSRKCKRLADSGTLASKFATVARERAEARFVIEYRQLVSAESMAAFHHELQQLEVPRSSVRFGAELGRGQSGVVFRGSFLDRDCSLAIKLRLDNGLDVGGAAAVADEALVLEAMLLNGLRHPGIVRLLAVVTTGAPILVCTEFMEHGDLRSYLRACRPTAPASALNGFGEISPRVMMAMAAKLGSAMAFVEQQSIIHRDVAARNVLVGKDATDVKMADLGAARNVHRTCEVDYSGVYIAKTEHSPARWMALEALQEAKFSHKSDVFAFGVLLWEILSLGQTPWGAFGVAAFTQALVRGERLAFPKALGRVPSDVEARAAMTIYEIAVRCWKEDPTKRPHFHQLEAELAVHRAVLTTTVVPAVLESATNVGGSETFQTGQQHSDLVEMQFQTGAVRSNRDDLRKQTVFDADGYVEDALFKHSPVLDADGYVEDAPFKHSPILDADGYVEDAANMMLSPTLDGSGSVEDLAACGQPSSDFRRPQGWVGSPLSNVGGSAVTTTGRVDKPSAMRSARSGSLYLGFAQAQSACTDLHGDETRL